MVNSISPDWAIIPPTEKAGYWDRACDKYHKDTDFLSICRDNTGDVLSEDAENEYVKRQNEVTGASWRTAHRLEKLGIPVFKRLTHPTVRIGLHSHMIEEMPMFRGINFLPSVAKVKRAPMLRHLEYYIRKREKHEKAGRGAACKRFRMWVVTSGKRCDTGYIKKRFKWLNTHIRKLRDKKWFKNRGIEIIFRSNEIGSAKYDDNGTLTFHPHSHLIVEVTRRIPKKQYSALLSRLHSYFGTHFKDAGRIRDIKEACKYCVKPFELDGMPDFALGMIYDQLFRSHLVQPMGNLKEEKNEIIESGDRLQRHNTESGPVLRRVANWNAHVEEVDFYGDEEECKFNPDFHIDDIEAQGEGETNVIIARLAPGPFFGPVTEPAVLVRNFNGSTDSLISDSWIRSVSEVSKEFWEMGEMTCRADGRSPSRPQQTEWRFRVHKTPVSVPARNPNIKKPEEETSLQRAVFDGDSNEAVSKTQSQLAII